jgi:hypothetical protein
MDLGIQIIHRGNGVAIGQQLLGQVKANES